MTSAATAAAAANLTCLPFVISGSTQPVLAVCSSGDDCAMLAISYTQHAFALLLGPRAAAAASHLVHHNPMKAVTPRA